MRGKERPHCGQWQGRANQPARLHRTWRLRVRLSAAQRLLHLRLRQRSDRHRDQAVGQVGIVLQLASGLAKDSRILDIHAVGHHACGGVGVRRGSCQHRDAVCDPQTEAAPSPAAGRHTAYRHVRRDREVTVEALPASIPERLSVDVSAMVIGDTIQLSTVKPPEGVKLMADNPDEVTLATLNPPRVEEEPEPSLEEETALVGEGEEGAPEAAEEGEAADEQGGDGEDAGD